MGFMRRLRMMAQYMDGRDEPTEKQLAFRAQRIAKATEDSRRHKIARKAIRKKRPLPPMTPKEKDRLARMSAVADARKAQVDAVAELTGNERTAEHAFAEMRNGDDVGETTAEN